MFYEKRLLFHKRDSTLKQTKILIMHIFYLSAHKMAVTIAHLGTILKIQKPWEALIWIVSLRKYYILWRSLFIIIWTFLNVQKFWDLFTGTRDDNNINKNSRQDNINNSSSSNNNKKTLEDFQNCGIISRQEPAYFPKWSTISRLEYNLQ